MQEYRTTDFRIKVRKSVVPIYCSAWFLVSLFPLLPNKTGAEICPLFGQISVPVLPVRAGAHPSCRNRMDSHRTDRRGVQRGKVPLALGHPIGASSNPVGTRFSVGKSSVLYLCFRLTPGRGWLRHLQPGQMGSGQTLFGGSRSGGFCSATDESAFAHSAKSA